MNLGAADESIRQADRRDSLALPPPSCTICSGEEATNPDGGSGTDRLDRLDLTNELDVLSHTVTTLAAPLTLKALRASYR